MQGQRICASLLRFTWLDMMRPYVCERTRLPLFEMVRYEPIDPPDEWRPRPWLRLPAWGAGPFESALCYFCYPAVIG